MTKRPRLLIASLVTLLAAGLLIYSQIKAFAWDEGWHLLAAQSILRGKRLYLDFCYPQTPLNAYWNAAWMRLFGDTWRTAHAVAAVMTALAVLLTADYLHRRFPVERWRLTAAVVGVVVVGLNAMVFEFGTVGQAYALALFLIVAAFRATVAAVDRGRLLLPAAAGFLSCAAANATLLTAPVAPVLLLWALIYNRAGNRWAKLGAFMAGGAIPFLPLAWFFIQSPRQTLFNVIEYNLYYRRLNWEGATEHDIGVLLSWIDSSQALLLLLLAAAGLWFVWKRSQLEGGRRAEFYLCAWLAAALALHISRGHPNFERYYLLTVPFLATLACAGLYAIGSRMVAPESPFWPAAALCFLVCLGFGKSLYDTHGDYVWREAEEIARKVNQVTPPGGMILADELTYFVSRRQPPSGMELADSHKFHLAPATMAEQHLVSKQELDRRTKAGVFDTIETWEEEDKIKELGLAAMYKNKEVLHEAHIFWERR
jgi:hypothetical protein